MQLWQSSVIFVFGGAAYVLIELAFRGWTHPSMFVVGGLCVLLIGRLDTVSPGLPLAAQAFLGAGIITAMELVSGLIVNVALDWRVWDYSAQPLNFMGQICLKYSLLWIPLSLMAVFADDVLRRVLFGTTMPMYRWF